MTEHMIHVLVLHTLATIFPISKSGLLAELSQ